MSRSFIKYIVLTSGLLSLMTCLSSQAAQTETIVVTPGATAVPAESKTTTTTTQTTIITPSPAPKEVIATPSGYVNCFVVSAGWYQNIWVPQHRVCQYANSVDKVAWVEGYWACSKYKIDQGICTDWTWKAGHWVSTLMVY